MGTTVTTNLGLIKPDTSDKIKADLPVFDGWAAQNTVNMNKVDDLFRDDATTYTLNFTASTSNPTLGAGGFTEGKYVRLWPRMVLALFRVYTGVAGFAAGTGNYRVNLPFAMDATLDASDGGRGMPIGKTIFKDNSAVLTSSVFLSLYDPINDCIIFELSQGDIFSNTHPLGTDDRLSGYFIYPTSAP